MHSTPQIPTYSCLTIERPLPEVIQVWLNRPERHNALNAQMIDELIACFDWVRQQSPTLMILGAHGKYFSAGADVDWLHDMAHSDPMENHAGAARQATMLQKLYQLPCLTVARVQGSAFGGGLGLIACCNMAIATKLSKLCFSEAKLGLVPAVVAPYVIEAIGPRQAKRYFMTAEVLSARRARRLGLLSETVSEDDLDATIEQLTQQVLQNGPNAMAFAQQLVDQIKHQAIDHRLADYTADAMATIRASDEAREGLDAFINKRTPNYECTATNRLQKTPPNND